MQLQISGEIINITQIHTSIQHCTPQATEENQVKHEGWRLMLNLVTGLTIILRQPVTNTINIHTPKHTYDYKHATNIKRISTHNLIVC